MNAIVLERDVLGTFDATIGREWLVTNGLGGYASGTLSGCNTRRYHGLLVASLRPPVECTMMAAKLDVVAHYRNRIIALATNEYADGTIDPRGYLQLHSFRLEGQLPVWTWLVDDAQIEQRLWMAHGQNTTYVTYTVTQASDVVELELTPLCTYRDRHSQNRGASRFFVSRVEQGINVDAFYGARPYRILVENGTAEIADEWYWNFKHRVESERGLDDVEDLFRPAIIRTRLSAGNTIAIVLTAEAAAPEPAANALAREIKRQNDLLVRADILDKDMSSSIGFDTAFAAQLILAADQFIVERYAAAGAVSDKTVVAGYPWFSDWGRDTMIALPGLTLATHRYDDAANILRTFAKFVSEGMLPNRFPDAGVTPEYNAVDATLWYFVAIDEYFRSTQEIQLIEELYPVLRDIVDFHLRGTRYGIRVDPQDGLLFAGEPGVQLTWMDAKVGDAVVTPRSGKPVEINALWFNALAIMKGFAQVLRDDTPITDYGKLAEQVRQSFNEKYWCATLGHLYDVIHGPDGELHEDGKRYDASLRPNQLFAVSLRHSLLDDTRARAVVDVCAAELCTPVGLRSLSPRDARYVGRYAGNPRIRDAAYHQGTAWSWLLGPFVTAHFRVYRDARVALQFLEGQFREGMSAHLRDACIGQVGEIFDGDVPFTARGCYAQAWGVAELLRVWRFLTEAAAKSIE